MQRLGFSTSGRGKAKRLYHLLFFFFGKVTSPPIFVNEYLCFQGRPPHRAEEDGEQAARLQSWIDLAPATCIASLSFVTSTLEFVYQAISRCD